MPVTASAGRLEANTAPLPRTTIARPLSRQCECGLIPQPARLERMALDAQPDEPIAPTEGE